MDQLRLPFDQYQRYKLIQEVIQVLRASQPMRILDVGGAPGIMRPFFPSDEVVIIDLDATGCDLCGTGTSLPFDAAAFDAVVTTDTLEHVPPHERQEFVQELARVTNTWLLIAAPFDDPQVVQAEEVLQQLVLARYLEGNRFIEEHRQNGLPDLSQTLGLLRSAGFDTVVLPNGYLHRWLLAISLFFLLQARFDDPELSGRVNAYYNRSFYREDNREPSYRKLIVAGRAADDALSRLPSLLVAPGDDDSARDLINFQVLNLLVQMLGERWSERCLQAEARLQQLHREHEGVQGQLEGILASKTWRIAQAGLRVYKAFEAVWQHLTGPLRKRR